MRPSSVMHNRSAWVLLRGWLVAAATGVGGVLLIFPFYCGLLVLGQGISGTAGAGVAFIASIGFGCTAYGAGTGWAQGRVVEATHPAWQGPGFGAAWCRATALGMGLGCLVFGVVLFLSNQLHGVGPLASDWEANAALVAGLATLGLAQWWVLRRGVRRASFWIPLTIIAWEGGGQVSRFLFDPAIHELTLSQTTIAPEILPLDGAYILVAALTAGLLTGLGMVWLSHHRIDPAQDRSPTAESV